jgi:5-methylcytosine-specific restriction protein A
LGGGQIDFVEKNERGRRMYSAGLNNYIRFAEGIEFAEAGERATVLDFAVPVEKSVCVETMEWRRNRIIKEQALEFAQYKCEVDSGHITFIAAATMKPYMEGHHAVPMKEQNNFDVSLDVYANIVCLCPICHRLLHYGKVSQKREVLEQIYIARDDRLQNSGIYLTKDQFLNIAE